MGYEKRPNFVIGANKNMFTHLKNNNERAFHGASDVDVKRSTGRLKAVRAKVHKHWRRFWCYYLVAAIIFLAVFLPVSWVWGPQIQKSRASPLIFDASVDSFLVMIPAIAQTTIDDTNLPVYSAEILDPKADSISFTLHTSLNVPKGLRIRTNAFNLSLFNCNVEPRKPYLSVGLLSYTLKVAQTWLLLITTRWF